MNIRIAHATVYRIETLEESQQILAKWKAEREHKACEECKGALSLDACVDGVRAELATFSEKRASGNLAGDFTAREIYLISKLDAWAAVQPKVADQLADTDAIFNEQIATRGARKEND